MISNPTYPMAEKIVTILAALCLITITSLVQLRFGSKRLINNPKNEMKRAQAKVIRTINKVFSDPRLKTPPNMILSKIAGDIIVRLTKILAKNTVLGSIGIDLIIHKLFPSKDIEAMVELVKTTQNTTNTAILFENKPVA